MDITLFPQHWSAILCICIMIGSLVVAYLKKLSITLTLIISNIIIFIITLIFSYEIIYGPGLGFRAVYLSPEYFPQLYTLFTSMFIHGGFAHIFGNMLVFFFIGAAFEERVGWKKFLIIYLVSGICGSLTQSLLSLNYPDNWFPLIGASGAIFGIMGAFAFSYPRDEVVMPVPVGIMIITKIKVMYAVVIFGLMETAIVWYESAVGAQSGTAHFAHLGGLISGAILAAVLIKNKKNQSTASAQTIYYDPTSQNKPGEIDFKELDKLAITPELKEMLKRIKNETLPQVRDIWLDYFLEKTICPKCGSPLTHFDEQIWCERCSFKTKY